MIHCFFHKTARGSGDLLSPAWEMSAFFPRIVLQKKNAWFSKRFFIFIKFSLRTFSGYLIHQIPLNYVDFVYFSSLKLMNNCSRV